MFDFLKGQRANTNVSLNSLPDTTYNPVNLAMHQRALNGTMYGLGGIVKADVIDGVVKFVYARTGEAFSTVREAFNKASTDGVTTFTRLTGRLEDSSLNMRGLGGMEQRLIDIKKKLKTLPENVLTGLGISDPSKLYFEIGTFRSVQGDTQMANKIREGVVVPDGSEFNLLKVLVGDPGRGAALSFQQISELFSLTSDDVGGIFGREELINSLLTGNTGTLFSKVGKRIRGAIGLRDVSLAGDNLKEMLQLAGIGGDTLNETNVKVFNISEDLSQITKNYETLVSDPNFVKMNKLAFISDPTGISARKRVNISEFLMQGLDEEQKAFYGGVVNFEDLTETLKATSFLDEEGKVTARGSSALQSILDGVDSSSKEVRDVKSLLKSAFESQYDGTSVINSKVFNAMRSQMQSELTALEAGARSGKSSPQIESRIIELRSQLQNMTPDNFQAITSRIFFQQGNLPKMVKAVVDQATLRGPLSKYALITTDVAMKRETAIMRTNKFYKFSSSGNSRLKCLL
jgi:hypothetical protein